MVSPGAGRCGTWMTRSVLELPTTTIFLLITRV
jgi:hypothetical protein